MSYQRTFLLFSGNIQVRIRISKGKGDDSLNIQHAFANDKFLDRQAAIDADCNGFLSKPLQIADLLDTLKLHLSLNWIYQGKQSQPINPSADQPMIIPPTNIINQLVQYVRIGDLLGLKQQLNELIITDPGYQPFALRIRALANEFRIGEIKTILNEQTGKQLS